MLRAGERGMTIIANTRACTMAIGIALAASTSAHAADYWVGPEGDDAATGSMGEPWATIEHADSVVVSGDVVHVLPGEYGGTIETVASGKEDAPIVFVSEEPWGARLVAAGGGWIARGDWVDIVGFEYTGDAAVGMLAMGSHIRYLSNWVHHLQPMCDGNGGAAIDAGNYEATDVDMIGNVVHDIWADDADGTPCNRVQGLYHAIPIGTVANNIAWHNSGWGIHTWHNPSDLVITNNLVFDNGGGGIIIGAGDSPGDGYADNFLVANNIVMHNPLGIYEYGATGLGNRYIANLVYENGEDIILQNGLVDEGTIQADPGLVDFQLDGSGDYQLAPGSPAIDAGTPEGAPMTDIDGVVRPQGAGFDIGPYELPVDAGTTGGDEDGTTSDGSADDTGGIDPDDGDTAASVGDDAPDPTTGSDVASDTSSTSGAGENEDNGCGCVWRSRATSRWNGSALLLFVVALLRRRKP
jgi:hypothetical protein